jgi:hypothetical protein
MGEKATAETAAGSPMHRGPIDPVTGAMGLVTEPPGTIPLSSSFDKPPAMLTELSGTPPTAGAALGSVTPGPPSDPGGERSSETRLRGSIDPRT